MWIPRDVFQETAGSKDSPDALMIASAVGAGWIQVIDSIHDEVNQLAESAGIERGEAAAILLAREEDGVLLIDDKLGRGAAEILGVTCLGTVGVLLQAISKSILGYDEFITILDRMIDLGFRLDSRVYRRAISVARSLSE
jgi:predicted nucleic acid-binding protein